MKALKLFLAALAAASLAACAKNETITTTTDSDSDSADARYMAVTLSMGVSTKATSYESGSAAESGVDTDNSGFLFYDDNGNYVTYGEFASGTSWTSSSSSDYVENTATTVILGPSAATPSSVVAIFNYSSWKNYIGLTLDGLMEKTNTLSSQPSSSGDFIMASAGLLSGDSYDTYSVATSVSGNIKSSEDEATDDPVTIYVERQVAKVKIGINSDGSSDGQIKSSTTDDGTTTYYADLASQYTYIDWDATNKKSTSTAWVRVNINGWGLNATNSSAYLLKNDDTDKYSGSGWYDTSTESYLWAKDINYTYSTSDTYGDNASGVYEGVDYVKYSDLNSCSTSAIYTMENTMDKSGQEATTALDAAGYPAATTTVALAASLSLDTSSSSSYSSATVNSNGDTDLYINSGIIFSLNGIIAQALEEVSSNYTSDEAGSTALTPNDVTVTLSAYSDASTNSCIYQVSNVNINEGKSVYKGGEETTNTTDLATALNQTSYLTAGTDNETTTGLKYYYHGKCYYQAVIEHEYGSDGKTLNGVVRNHLYDITLGTISNIGGPVSSDSDELIIIPGADNTNYLAATISILSWISSSQTVNF